VFGSGYILRMQRRHILQGLALAAFANLSEAQVAIIPADRKARLVIVGGAEDRLQDKQVLRHFLQYAGGEHARIRLITAASGVPDAVGESYAKAFSELGAIDFSVLPLSDRSSAFNPELTREILRADGIFMSGGDQSRLMASIWETPVMGALHQAFHFNGCCIGGTSAGAAVMSRHMIAQGAALLRPRKDAIDTDIGLGLLSLAIVDQHFSERRRLARLLSALARRPDLLGVGIDEDTALVVEPDTAIEVIGRGTVTLVDASQASTNMENLEVDEQIEMLGLQLHTLPAGHRYEVNLRTPPARWPAGLLPTLRRLVRSGPVRT
jgi:cyanophycinase